MTKTIRFYKKDQKHMAMVNGVEHRGYTLSKIPKKFGVKVIKDFDEEGYEIEKEGIYQWFNFKGLTYVEVQPSW